VPQGEHSPPPDSSVRRVGTAPFARERFLGSAEGTVVNGGAFTGREGDLPVHIRAVRRQ
jgi:hypothetical protein